MKATPLNAQNFVNAPNTAQLACLAESWINLPAVPEFATMLC
jgi:hypothetical protein